MDKELIEKMEFGELLETLVKAAMPSITHLGFFETRGVEVVVAHHKNGEVYTINVSGNSLIAIAYDVIDFLRFK